MGFNLIYYKSINGSESYSEITDFYESLVSESESSDDGSVLLPGRVWTKILSTSVDHAPPCLVFRNIKGQSLGLFTVTITKAMIICHHFKRCVGTVEFENGLTAAAVLSISSRINEEDIDKISIIDYFWRVFKTEEPNTKSEEFQALLKSVSLLELIICRMLKFTFHYKLAHEYLVPFLRDIHEREEFKEKWGYFCTVVWRAVTTIYESKRCLDYEASELATACISFACLMCNINFSPSKDWQLALSASATNKKCNNIFMEILLACYKHPGSYSECCNVFAKHPSLV